MTRPVPRYTGAAVVAIVILSACSLVLGGDKDGKKKRKTVYEYCTLSIITSKGAIRTAFDRQGETTLLARDMPDLFSKLNVSSDDESILAFMNHLGIKGWRLVEIEQARIGDARVTLYYFERTRRR